MLHLGLFIVLWVVLKQELLVFVTFWTNVTQMEGCLFLVIFFLLFDLDVSISNRVQPTRDTCLSLSKARNSIISAVKSGRVLITFIVLPLHELLLLLLSFVFSQALESVLCHACVDLDKIDDPGEKD